MKAKHLQSVENRIFEEGEDDSDEIDYTDSYDDDYVDDDG